jgi:hypothetical protein
MCFDCRSFQSATRRLVSSTIYGPSAQRAFGFLCGLGGALAFHLAAVEVQGRILAERMVRDKPSPAPLRVASCITAHVAKLPRISVSM